MHPLSHLDQVPKNKLLDVGLDNEFLDMLSKAQARKAKIQVGLHQTKNFCTTKETINRVKKQPTKWEKIFANHTSDKRLISKIYEEHKQPNPKMGRRPK